MRATNVPIRFPDRYEGARLVASGGMGQVYQARDNTLGQVVAIKLLDDRFDLEPQTRNVLSARPGLRPSCRRIRMRSRFTTSVSATSARS